MKKAVGLILLVLVITGGLYFFNRSEKKDVEQTASKKAITSVAVNKDTFVLADIGIAETLDPAKAYDTFSATRIWNIYQTLIFFDGPHLGKFVPVLSTEVPTVANGGISEDGKTYIFTIRQGVKFHEGGELTAEDVAYSLKRAMICDPDGGPMWMLLEALTGNTDTRKGGKIIPGIMNQIDKSIEVKENKVIIHLPRSYPPLMGILCYSAFSIIDKEWAIANKAWDGNIKHAARYNKPRPGKEPLHGIANGTGPFKLKIWEPSKQFVFERFDGYWGPKPALKTAIIKYVPEWNKRKLMLQTGEADRIHAEKSLVNEVEAMKNVSVSRVPQLAVTSVMFCQKINPRANPNIGSGKLDGNGIPFDFFADINVRKAFLHAYDRDTFKRKVLNDLGSMPPTPLVNGMPFQSEVPHHTFDLEKS
ncbi:ABC transporter substrate-binding protein, partial [bacterium]|nr:ABC transporter substrate-binding protein [bacterium]